MIKSIISALPLIAAALGRKYGVKVHIGGERAYTNGRDIHIPALPLDAGEDTLNLARGFLDHEAAHLRETDFSALKKTQLSPLEKHVWNIIEDYMVEKKLSAIYPGCRHNFTWLIRYLFLDQKDRDENSPATDIFSWILIYLRSLSVPELAKERDRLAESMDQHYPGLLSELKPLVMSIPDRSLDTGTNIPLARQIVKIISEYQETGDSRAKEGSASGKGTLQEDEASGSPGMDALRHLISDPSPLNWLSIGELAGEKLGCSASGVSNRISVAMPVSHRANLLSADEIAETRRATISLRTKLQGLLQAAVHVRSHIGRRGKLVAKLAARLAVNDARIFTIQGQKQGFSTAIHILLDASGSMLGTKILLASQASFAVAAALQNIRGIGVAVTAFPGGASYNSGSRVSWQTVAPVLAYKERLHTRFGIICNGSTPMAEALWWVLQQTVALSEERKIILIISDGVPDNFVEARNAIEAHQAHGHEVYGIGISHPAMQLLLPPRYARTIFDLNELPAAMFEILRHGLLKREGYMHGAS